MPKSDPIQVIFAVGSDNVSCATVYIENDESLEGDHGFEVTITATESAASIMDPSTSFITIIDDECEFTLSFNELCTNYLSTKMISCLQDRVIIRQYSSTVCR